MLRPRFSALSSLLALVTLWCCSVKAADEVPAALRSSWESRQKEAETVRIKWREVKTEFAPFPGDDDGEGSVQQKYPYKRSRDNELLLSGSRARYVSVKWSSATGEENAYTSVFNGTQAASLLTREGSSNGFDLSKRQFADSSLIELQPLLMAARPLAYDSIRMSNLTVTLGAIGPDGRDWIKLISRTPLSAEGARNEYFCDAQSGAVIRFDIYGSTTLLYARTEMRYGSSGTTWIPQAWAITTFLDDGKPWYEFAGEIREITFPSSVADNEFEIIPPKGAIITDQSTRSHLLINDKGERVPLPSRKEGSSNPALFWVSLGAIAIVALVAGYFVFRKRGMA